MKHKSTIMPALFALIIGLLLLTFNQTARAQSALDGFDPNANGTVRSIAVQPDGKIIVGGDFTTLAPSGGAQVVRSHIARLNTDGTLDTGFDPNANNTVNSIAIQPDGRIIVGGDFTTISPNGGATVTRSGIARVNADGTLDTAFDPYASSSVYTVALQPDGKILLGGNFTSLSPNGGATVTRNGIARLNTNGTLDTAFNPNANDFVYAVILQSDGKILIGGFFTTLSPNGGATVTRRRIARVNADGTLDTAFNPNANNAVYAIQVQADGKIIAGGGFTTVSPNGGAAVTRNRIARFERDGLLDRTLNLSMVGSFVFATAIQPDGKIIIGGVFSSVLGTARNNIARLNTDGTLDTAFSPNVNSSVYSIAVQSDGKILLGGTFGTIGGVSRNYIARLNADGTLDTAFNPNAGSLINSIAVQSDGKILLVGSFTTIGGVSRNYIARLNADGTLDTAFDPNANTDVYSIAVQSDGKILLGGTFTTIGGVSRNYIARLNADGTLDTAFNPNASNQVGSIAVQSDGKILLGGTFGTIGGVSRNNIARLNADGTLDTAFNPNANGGVLSVVVQSDGKILLGGNFTTVGGVTRNYIARLNTNSTPDAAFNPNAGSLVYSIAVQSDGKILLGAGFNTIGGQSRNLFARLSNDTAALSTLTVTKTTITLTRSGSAAQFNRVVFEQSLDNGATYTTLGTATNSFAAPADGKIEKAFAPDAPTAAGYTLTGLNLMTGQNILIRARGFYNAGFQNGSQTIEDKVQTAFLIAPTAAAVSIGGRVFAGKERGLSNAFVTLTDMRGTTRTARTNAFGYYCFDETAAGETYILSVSSKRYQFAPQVLNVTDDFDDINFAPIE